MSRDRPAFIGIDLGTSGVRAVRIGGNGEILATARTPLPPSIRTADGTSLQEPRDWWDAVVLVLRKLHEQRGNGEVRALAVDGTSASLLLTDRSGLPLGPALMYDDRQGGEFLPLIHRHAPADSPVRSASSSLAKLLTLCARARSGDGLLAQHQADWITGKLAGRCGISDEHNCLKLGYDAVNRHWPSWLEAFHLPTGLLPIVRPAGTVLSAVAPGIGRLTGLPPHCRLVAGTTDSTAAAIASGIKEPGEAVTSLGSTLVMKVLSRTPLFHARYGVYSHRLGSLWLVGGASNTGGAVLDRFFSPDALARLSATLDGESSTDLDYYPLLRPGERFPVNDPERRPRLDPRPDDDGKFLQGLLEGMARIERSGYELLNHLGAPYPRSVTSLGGGSANAPWEKIRERILGVSVRRGAKGEAAYGTALLARIGIGGGKT